MSDPGKAMPRQTWSAKWPMTVGFVALIALVGGLGFWSVNSKLAGAVIASGMVQVESNRQVIQHPEGGVVGAIYVDDGDTVTAGQVLIQFDQTMTRSELTIVSGQLVEIQARRARLQAERDDNAGMIVSPALAEAAIGNPDVKSTLEGQARLFEARNTSVRQQTEQLLEQRSQFEFQIIGAQAQLAALKSQILLIAGERRDQQALFDKGLTSTSRVSALQREEARLQGQIGSLDADIAQIRGRVASTNIDMLSLKNRRREEAITALRDIQYSAIELAERELTLKERLARLEVRSPVSGIIYGLQVFALQSVVQPAAPMMYVIPQDQPLIVTARIDAIHVDQIFIGQPVTMRFSAFDQRQTPELAGKVKKLSADVFVDEATGRSFYSVELFPNEGELAKLDGSTILPGMPVEAFIQTDERTPLSYLTKPLTDYFARAMKG